jgi:hypothetical protein
MSAKAKRPGVRSFFMVGVSLFLVEGSHRADSVEVVSTWTGSTLNFKF